VCKKGVLKKGRKVAAYVLKIKEVAGRVCPRESMHDAFTVHWRGVCTEEKMSKCQGGRRCGTGWGLDWLCESVHLM
jgi:hypothetical protein